MRAAGVREVFAWGRGDLEDLLFLPENDHLLFAYFGVSLQVRRRSQVTELRDRLARKRQVYRAVGDPGERGAKPVLVRDPTVAGYPFRDRVTSFDDDNPPWLWTFFRGHSNPDLLGPLTVKQHHAWISADRKSFDFIDSCSHVPEGSRPGSASPQPRSEPCNRLLRYFHNEIPEDERGWLEVVGWIPLDDILLVDDLGDAFNSPPHILTTRERALVGEYMRVVRTDRHQRSLSGITVSASVEWGPRRHTWNGD